MPDLNDTMRAAVYLGDRRVEVEERPVPEVGAERRAARGEPLRDLRQRPALRARGLGSSRLDRGPRVHRTGRRRWATPSPTGRSATRWSAVRARDAASASTASPAGRRCAPAGVRSGRTTPGRARSPTTSGRRAAVAAPPRRPVAARRRARRAARGRAARHHPSGVQPGQRVLVTGAGPIGALTVAALVAMGVTDIVVSEPRATRRALCERLGAAAVEPESLVRPALAERRSSTSRSTSRSSARATRDAMEAALAQLKRAGTLVLVGAGMQPPRFDPNRILLNELVITGAFCYDADGFDAALELLAPRRLPDRRARRARRRRPRRAARRDRGPQRRRHPGQGACRPGPPAGRRAMKAETCASPRFNHVAMSVPADLLGEAGRADLVPVLRRGVRLAGAPDRDRRPQEARLRGARGRAVRVPDRRRRADGLPPPRPLRPVGRDDGRARRACSTRAKAFREHDDRVDVIDKADDRPRDAEDHEHLRRLPAADDGRDPALGVHVTLRWRRVRTTGLEARVHRVGRRRRVGAHPGGRAARGAASATTTSGSTTTSRPCRAASRPTCSRRSRPSPRSRRSPARSASASW